MDQKRQERILGKASLVQSIQWTVGNHTNVDKGQIIGTIGSLQDGTEISIHAPLKGTFIQNKFTKPIDSSNNEEMIEIGIIEYCIHPLVTGRTCMICLAILDDTDHSVKSMDIVSHGQKIRLNAETAQKFDEENITRQLAAKKLSLVLDLDHTLLHAVRAQDIVGGVDAILAENHKEMHIFSLLNGHVNQQHVVKLRPRLNEFLVSLSEIYDLFIYTQGTRAYAEEIVKIIDPNHQFFQHRIVARTDTPDMAHKSLKLLFPSANNSMILILDDRIDVWKENEGNVFLIEPYHFFSCTAEVNNASGVSQYAASGGVDKISGKNVDELDDYLAIAARVLKAIHSAFYDLDKIPKLSSGGKAKSSHSTEAQMTGSGKDVKVLLVQQKRTILKDCHIVYSGVFPTGPNIPRPESHFLWKLAIDLGASVSHQLILNETNNNKRTTHLIIHPDRLGTQKYVVARKENPKIFIVTPDWVLKCGRTWCRVDEKDFAADEWKQKIAEKARQEQETLNMRKEDKYTALSPTTADSLTPEKLNGAQHTEDTDKHDISQTTPIPQRNVVDMSKSSPTTGGVQRRRPRPIGQRKYMKNTNSVSMSNVGKGIVASGGTLDFLSNLTKLKSNYSSNNTLTKQEGTQVMPNAAAMQPSKSVDDVDDAFQRLIAAEEREEAVERKRQATEENDDEDDIKSALQKRRKRIKNAARTNDAIEENDDDLDDLEADILGDL